MRQGVTRDILVPIAADLSHTSLLLAVLTLVLTLAPGPSTRLTGRSLLLAVLTLVLTNVRRNNMAE